MFDVIIFSLNVQQSLGQVGRVSQIFPTGDVRVGVNGMNWTFNPACLTLAPGENPPEVPGWFPQGIKIFKIQH